MAKQQYTCVGVMQGRLLPKYLGRYQAHPVGYWQEEFHIAASMGLGLIEFILDYNDVWDNPLMHSAGLEQIATVCAQTDVAVTSVCADCFMQAPLFAPESEETANSRRVLMRLIPNASELGITNIILPCVDNASLLRQSLDLTTVVESLVPFADMAEKCGVNLALETDLDPVRVAALLQRVGSARITVNYDIGNSAALGYDCRQELKSYGSKISDIHIKDRKLNGASVPLGTGAADFTTFFSELSKLNYCGPIIMQAFRDAEGIKIFKEQMEWIRPKLDAYFNKVAMI